ncbi:hypothetical protein FB45DRAFT_1117041 [Roridomyces roridus]|uniref:Uncharacterized protein n=1 Tax=Roridomyces roridus TaxID=1738132 RepID=A0AAD7B7H3_9AGAR|nr:hypothetical protein FB45DRAFT_1117041 [Roridomyces roridus]
MYRVCGVPALCTRSNDQRGERALAKAAPPPAGKLHPMTWPTTVLASWIYVPCLNIEDFALLDAVEMNKKQSERFSTRLEEAQSQVISIVTSRGIKNPDYLKPGDWRAPGYSAAGNNVLHVYTPTLSTQEACSIGAVAAAMQKSVKEGRQYEHAKRFYAICNPISLRIAKEQTFEQTFYKSWDDGVFRWNAMGRGRGDGDVFHFGFGHARSNTYGSRAGTARCFQAPTVRQLDGSWVNKADGLIMWVPIPTKIHQQFLAMIAADLNSTAFPNNIAARERMAQEKIRAEKAHAIHLQGGYRHGKTPLRLRHNVFLPFLIVHRIRQRVEGALRIDMYITGLAAQAFLYLSEERASHGTVEFAKKPASEHCIYIRRKTGQTYFHKSPRGYLGYLRILEPFD